ncbi:MAG: hypothetical protein HY399_05070 [Elusimicrobia bacterium]|nr:hypothetical protein [Elusimicrobiota bacterium]
MIKIKRFKITLREREILRRAKKKKMDLALTGFNTEGEVQTFLQSLPSLLQPAVLYDSFSPDTIQRLSESSARSFSDPSFVNALSPVPGLAFSVGIATLGNRISEFSQSLGGSEQPLRAELVALAKEVALEEATQFALSLIEGEAKEEKCELSPIQNITDPSLLQTLFVELETEKIGVAWKENQPMPLATTAFSVSWLAKRGKTAKR